MHISLQIIIAALSVLGLYFCLRTIASLMFTNKQITAAVIIDNEKQLENLEFLLSEAEEALFAARGRRLAVFIPANIWEECGSQSQSLVKEISEGLGAEFYIFTN